MLIRPGSGSMAFMSILITWEILTKVDRKPEYEGGEKEIFKFIIDNMDYPAKALKNSITGQVIISFVIMSDGSIQGIDFYKKADNILNLEALRVFNLLPNKWKPGEINGQKVNALLKLPFTFVLAQHVYMP